MPAQKRVLRGVLAAVPVGLLLLLVLWGRVFYGSMEAYNTGEALLKGNQTIRAVTYFDRSLHWYAPLNPYVERSAKRLWEIGEAAEQQKDIRLALIAYESIRNGFHGVSHVFKPGRDWIQRSESKILSLASLQGKGAVGSPKKDPQPDVLWSAVVVTSFLGWIGSLLGLIVATFRQGETRRGKGILWLGFSFLCFVLWLLGMAKA
ncbi:MAG: hypothetical protein MUC98_18180 [Desulfobacterota bacterium]|nr:hypothetical protein [Thermodesulfobacteriota bacterium]